MGGGGGGDEAGKVVIRSLSCSSMTGSPVHLAVSRGRRKVKEGLGLWSHAGPWRRPGLSSSL